YLLAFIGMVRPHEAVPQAKAAAQRALELDDRLPEAQISLGVIHGSYDWNWPAGQRSFERAIELDADFPTGHTGLANFVQIPQGRLTEACADLRKALALDPFLPSPRAELSWLLGLLGRPDDAIRNHSETMAMHPNFAFASEMMALAYLA